MMETQNKFKEILLDIGVLANKPDLSIIDIIDQYADIHLAFVNAEISITDLHSAIGNLISIQYRIEQNFCLTLMLNYVYKISTIVETQEQTYLCDKIKSFLPIKAEILSYKFVSNEVNAEINALIRMIERLTSAYERQKVGIIK